jgi:hypothetical protein
MLQLGRSRLGRGRGWLLALVTLLGSAHAAAQPAREPPETVPEDSAVSAAEKAAADSAREAAEAKEAAEQATAAAARLEQRVAQQEHQLAQQQQRLDELQQASEDSAATADAALDHASAIAEEAEAARSRLSIYGFSDMGVKKTWIRQDASWTNVMPGATTFMMGNVNLYFDARPLPGFRALTEVRFTHYPHGSESGGNFERTNNSVFDINSPTGRNRVAWGGTVLERAWVEWNDYDVFRVRVGYWLTPYGIWNVDHGTPTLISLALPDFFAQEYLPTHQTGLQILGSVPTGSWELGYHATVSNGRTPGQLDETEDKAFGGRLFARFEDENSFALGASGYRGSYTEKTKTLVGVNPLQVVAEDSVVYDEYALAADVSTDIGPLRFRAEGVMQRLTYQDGARDEYGPGAGKPDYYRYNLYGLLAYRLPWWGVEPYLYLEQRLDGLDDVRTYSGGLNVRFNAAAQLKAQHGYLHFDDRVRQDNFHFTDIRFVMAF